MAKVIGLDPKLLRQCSCKNCASVIQYFLNEVFTYKSIDCDGHTMLLHCITCPNCFELVTDVKYY